MVSMLGTEQLSDLTVKPHPGVGMQVWVHQHRVDKVYQPAILIRELMSHFITVHALNPTVAPAFPHQRFSTAQNARTRILDAA
jgi:hypothetical protein